MSSDKFETLIDEFPEETDAVVRLRELITQAWSTPGRKEYSPTRMYDRVQPSNFRVLVRLLTSAAEKGLIRKSVRVLSTSGMGGIEDFDSILDVPYRIYDSRIGQFIDVNKDQLELIYSVER